MYDGVRKAPHRWGTSAATIERRTDMHEQLIKEIQKMVRDGEVPAKSVAGMADWQCSSATSPRTVA